MYDNTTGFVPKKKMTKTACDKHLNFRLSVILVSYENMMLFHNLICLRCEL